MLILALSLLGTANAGGLDLVEVGGSWGTPGATNPTAIWWNPAGIAVGGGTRFLVEGAPAFATITFDRTNPDYGDPADVDGDGNPDPYDYGGSEKLKFTGVVPFLGVSSDFGLKGLGVGAALSVPVARGGTAGEKPPSYDDLLADKAGAADFPASPGSYFLREGNITAIYTTVAAGYDIADKVAIGVSGSYVDSTWYAVTDVETLSTLESLAGGFASYADQTFEDPDYVSILTFDRLKDHAFTFGAGIHVTPIDQLGIALSYNHGVHLDHTGNVMVTTGCPPDSDTIGRLGVEAAGLCNATTPGTSTVSYDLPSRINAGIVVAPIEELRLEAFGGWVGWSAFTDYDIHTRVDAADIPDAADPESSAALISQDRLWARDNKDTFFVGLDGKGQVHEVLLVGGRVLYDHHAIPSTALSTNNYDADSLNLSALVAVGPFSGLRIGASFEQMVLATRTVTDSAFAVTLADERNEDRYYYPSANGTYSGGITRIGINVMGAFGNTRGGID